MSNQRPPGLHDASLRTVSPPERYGRSGSATRAVSVAVALMVLIGGGIAHGTITHRWQPVVLVNDGPETRLDSIPLHVGEWDGVIGELDASERDAAGVTHYLLRTYTNRTSGATVTVTILYGPTGPLAVHLPTACYLGAGYQQRGTTRTRLIETTIDEVSARHQFAVADFDRPARPDQAQPRIYWSWSTSGLWTTPENPRIAFADSPSLFKLYVTFERPVGSPLESTEADNFLTLLLPQLQSVFETGVK